MSHRSLTIVSITLFPGHDNIVDEMINVFHSSPGYDFLNSSSMSLTVNHTLDSSKRHVLTKGSDCTERCYLNVLLVWISSRSNLFRHSPGGLHVLLVSLQSCRLYTARGGTVCALR